MHPTLKDAPPEILRSFHDACVRIAENICEKDVSPQNFAALVRFECERLADEQDFVDFTPKMREAFFQIALEALAEAFEINKAAIAPECPQNDFKEQEPTTRPQKTIKRACTLLWGKFEYLSAWRGQRPVVVGGIPPGFRSLPQKYPN
jgi:hypothetical protein